MQTIISALESILGDANFYRQLPGRDYGWDYGAMFEYFFAGTVLCIVVGWIFRLLKEGFYR